MNLKISLLSISISLFFLSFWVSSLAAEENITIPTYYPSPAGVYKSLRLYPRNDIAPESPCSTSKQEGEMVYYKDLMDFNKDSVLVCGPNDEWKKIEELGNASLWVRKDSDSDTYLSPQNVKWSVAIGTGTVSFGSYFAGDPPTERLQRAQLQVEGAISRQGTQLLGSQAAQDSQINLGVNDLAGNESITGRPDADIFGATVSGGAANLARGNYATVSGGVSNRAGNNPPNPPNPVINFGTVTGGRSNLASGQSAVVSGGESNQASGALSVVSGGRSNLASGLAAVVSGGQSNQAINNYAAVSGGASNTASGIFSVVSGGVGNIASGRYAVVSGGQSNTAAGDYSWAGGRNMQLDTAANRTFAWGYSAIPHLIADNDAFIIYSDAAAFRVEFGNSTPPLPSLTNRTNFFVYNLPGGSAINTLKYDSTTGQISYGSSSIRYKTKLRPIENALAKVKQLRGVYFNWKEGGRPGLGMIAEEVGEVIPEIVSYEANGKDARSLDYEKLVGLLVEAVKEQGKKIDELEQRKMALEKRVRR